ncbi:metal ABC transporter permease [Gracilibacillus saliphilus]|uniref:metal ABC transporter permease n=1 Tax=Gracilibacillus saliphilus TaxID=543890 RepID=UPI0013D7AB39|nr:iron chelate uptake ABC transporter family permease subunit [Gracilibacillus saliphilus]
MITEWMTLLESPNFRWVMIGSLLLGFSSGVIGCFVYLRKQSLISDGMAHATLPGVAFMYILFQNKSLPVLLIGATVTSLLATSFIQMIIKQTKLKTDAAIGVILSVFFGFGILLLSYIQQNMSGNQAGIDSFIFGQAASIVKNDVYTIGVVSLFVLLLTVIFFREFHYTTFDFTFSKGIGIPVKWINGLLFSLLVAVIVIGIQMVGVVLIVALLITPALAARYWTDSLGKMTIISGTFGAISGLIGTISSSVIQDLPTGPMIVLTASVLFFISLLFGFTKGLVVRRLVR